MGNLVKHRKVASQVAFPAQKVACAAQKVACAAQKVADRRVRF
jgi:hypothetical protein